YNTIYGIRKPFQWKWLGTIFDTPEVTLSCAEPKYRTILADIKLALSIIYVIIDDIAEVKQDYETLKKMMIVLQKPPSETTDDDPGIMLTQMIWTFVHNEIHSLPRYHEFNNLFTYDFKQVLNSAAYAYLINIQPEIINTTELNMYDSHGMLVYVLNGVDLMASPTFETRELAQLRTIFWHAQQMARIGNWLGTWKRELLEHDYSSGVIGYALEEHIVDLTDLNHLPSEHIMMKINTSGILDHLTDTWRHHYQIIYDMKTDMHSVDIAQYLEGLFFVQQYHLYGEGNI
ncbi:MAG: hypothetical protein KKC68_04455, partial [Candidatus Thermoplasmatota archaeon]|nr:hypothetical protein [Candidatus Thermoplasmatota archaeon]